MKLKHFFPLILVLACLLAASAAADSTPLMPGDIVTVDLTVTSKDAAFVQLGYEINEKVFEFVSAESDLGVAGENGFAGVRLGKPVTGKVATLTLRVKDTAKDGKVSIKPKVQSAYTEEEEKASAKAKHLSFVVKGKEGIKVNLKEGAFRVTSDKTAEFLSPADQSISKLTVPATVTVNGQDYTVTKIAPRAFKNLKKLTSVDLGDSVKSIGDNAFIGCKKLKTVSGGAALETIGNYAFRDCTSLTKFALGNKLTSIGKYAFYNCTKLSEVTGGKALIDIGNSAFQKCSALTKFTLESSVKTIGAYAFNSCTKLKTIKILTKKLSAKSVGEKAFNIIDADAVFTCPSKDLVKTYQEIFTAAGAPATAKFKK